MAPPLWKGEQKINRIFVPLLLAMALANLLVHLQALGLADTASRGTDVMLYLIILLLIILSGRVMPFFTRAVIPGHAPKQNPVVDKVTLIALGALILELLLLPTPWLTALLTLTLAVTQILRLFGWYHRGIWKLPILWVLYTGFFWIIAGLLLMALAQFDLFPANLARHALTLGGIGITTFGMMARVSLGHTGRPIDPAPAISLGFVLLNIAAAARVFGPLLLAEKYNLWIHLSGGLWVISFLLFSVVYLPKLSRPRVDGKAG
ncbi:MAG TPA: NnrS family protein [Sedimenticola sp.]|nr:NnrS family protein [Sedimenticola sp.]